MIIMDLIRKANLDINVYMTYNTCSSVSSVFFTSGTLDYVLFCFLYIVLRVVNRCLIKSWGVYVNNNYSARGEYQE